MKLLCIAVLFAALCASAQVSTIYNVRSYGAVANGVTDDAPAIKAAIANAHGSGGGIVFLPAGQYAVGSTLTVTNTVTIEGVGTGGYFFDLSETSIKGSRLKWIGACSTPMLLIQPSEILTGRPVVGAIVRDIHFNGNSLASQGIRIESAIHFVVNNVSVRDCVDDAVWIGSTTNSPYTGLILSYGGIVDGLYVSQRLTNNVANCLTLDGDPPSYARNGSTTLCTFKNLMLAHNIGDAINIVRGDHHLFENFSISRMIGGTGIGIDLLDVATGQHGVNYNSFIQGYSGGGGVYSHGTNTQPAVYNVFYGYSTSDSATLPTVESGSILYLDTDTGNLSRKSVTSQVLTNTGTIYANASGSGTGLDFNGQTSAGYQIRLKPNHVGVGARNNAGTADFELFRVNTINEFNVIAPSRFSGAVNISDGVNVNIGTTTGTKIGTAPTQKLGFYGAPPVAQQASTTDVRTALINLGLLAP